MNLPVPHIDAVRDRDLERHGAHAVVSADRSAEVRRLGLGVSGPGDDGVFGDPRSGPAVVGLLELAHPALTLEHVANLNVPDLAFAQDQVVERRDRIGHTVLESALSRPRADQDPASTLPAAGECDRHRIADGVRLLRHIERAAAVDAGAVFAAGRVERPVTAVCGPDGVVAGVVVRCRAEQFVSAHNLAPTPISLVVSVRGGAVALTGARAVPRSSENVVTLARALTTCPSN